MIPVWLFPCVAQAVCRLMEVGHVVSVKDRAVLCRKLELGGIVCLQFAGFNRSEDIDAASAQTPDEGRSRGVFFEVMVKVHETRGEMARAPRPRREMSAD